MQAPNVVTRSPMNRRQFLSNCSAVGIALPLLDAMQPVLAESRPKAGRSDDLSPRRFVAMCATLGFHAAHLFPEQAGRDYTLTPYLEELRDHRDQFTLFSGLSHPAQQGNNGHASELTWLTSAQRPGLAGFRNTVSLDQLIADRVGIQTRYPFLALSTSGRSLSWTPGGVEIPGETSPAKLFQALFIEGDDKQVESEIKKLKRGRSILDTVSVQARALDQSLGRRDKEKMDEYLTAVRDLEARLQQSEGWVRRPKPKVNSESPQDITDRNDTIGRQRLMYDMIVLALQTDSTRTITFQLSGLNSVPVIPGVNSDWHGLSHHGKDPDKIEELKIIEQAEFTAFSDFLSKLRAIEENGRSLLDHTAVLYGSNLGNASSHDWHNLPILLAGGGYRHGSYVAHDARDNTPLANLYVSLAQRMGVETRQFGSSTAESIRGLEVN